MTVLGSTCTRKLIDRTLICHAILYHFQIALFCGLNNRPSIPLTLFLLSRPLEQLEFIRTSSAPAERSFAFAPPTRPKRSILPCKLQSRYRRHLFNITLPFQLLLARRSLHQLSRFTIHFVQEFQIHRIQSRKNVLLHDVSALAAVQQSVPEQSPQHHRFPLDISRDLLELSDLFSRVF